MVFIGARYITETIGLTDFKKVYFYSYYPLVLYTLLATILIVFLILFYLDLKRKAFRSFKKRSVFLILLIISIIVIGAYRIKYN